MASKTRRNVWGEVIPNELELIKLAKSNLKSIIKMDPVPIIGNLVNENTRKYTGIRYFENIKKTTTTYRSNVLNDFSGIYVFYKMNKPVYVGISGTIIRRLKYHLFSKLENQSSFVFLIAQEQYKIEEGHYFDGLRKEFPFEDYRIRIQNEMIDEWQIKVLECSGGYNLFFF